MDQVSQICTYIFSPEHGDGHVAEYLNFSKAVQRSHHQIGLTTGAALHRHSCRLQKNKDQHTAFCIANKFLQAQL